MRKKVPQEADDLIIHCWLFFFFFLRTTTKIRQNSTTEVRQLEESWQQSPLKNIPE